MGEIFLFRCCTVSHSMSKVM